jgi:serine/threonine-protein kinase
MSQVRIQLQRGQWFFDDSKPLGTAGGFGAVFEGTDPNGDPIAVKRLHVTMSQAAHRELEIAKELAGKPYQHVLVPFDAGLDPGSGHYFVVMPRADCSLDDELAAHGPLGVAESLEILRQIATGLLEASNIVHRDLKPPNVLRHEGRWKIADYGIARFVAAATSLNTVKDWLSAEFAAPEQWQGMHATSATDVYALGCIAHVLLTGAPPFTGPDHPDFRNQHLNEAPPRVKGVDGRISSLVYMALRKSPEGRPTVRQFLDEVNKALSVPVVENSLAAEIQAVRAAEAQRVSKIEADAARERAVNDRRRALVKDGLRAFIDIVDELAEFAREQSLDRVDRPAPTSLIVRLGDDSRMHIQYEDVVPEEHRFERSRWEVLAMGSIVVLQASPEKWRDGATLWFMRLPGSAEFRWHEVSYRWSPLARGGPDWPAPVQDLPEKAGWNAFSNADVAASQTMHVVTIHRKPQVIDGPDSRAFIERWLERLTAAYRGRLRT